MLLRKIRPVADWVDSKGRRPHGRDQGVREIVTPKGLLPLPRTVAQLEKLKKQLLGHFNRSRIDPYDGEERHSLGPAGSGRVAVLSLTPVRVSLFWTGGASTVPSIPMEIVEDGSRD